MATSGSKYDIPGPLWDGSWGCRQSSYLPLRGSGVKGLGN